MAVSVQKNFSRLPAEFQGLQTSDVCPSFAGLTDDGMYPVGPKSLVSHMLRELGELLIAARSYELVDLHETAVGPPRLPPPGIIF